MVKHISFCSCLTKYKELTLPRHHPIKYRDKTHYISTDIFRLVSELKNGLK